MTLDPHDPSARIKVVGHVCLDLMPKLETEMPTPGSLVEVGPFELRVGGSVGNTGGALAALGASVDVEAVIGRDVFGDLVEQLLQSMGAQRVSARRVDEYGTSYSVVLEPRNGDRSFLHHIGANSAFDGVDVDLDGADLVHVGYPQVLPNLLSDGGRALTEFLLRARRMDVTTSVDFATVDGRKADVHDWRSLINTWAPLTDVLTPSIDDLVPFLGGRPTTHSEVTALADRLVGLGPAVVMITAGELGMAMRTNSLDRLRSGGSLLAALADDWADRQLYAPPAEVQIVRTTAAGDTATAGLLFGLAQSEKPERALRIAAEAAGLHCSGLDRLPPYGRQEPYGGLELQNIALDDWKADSSGVLHGPLDTQYSPLSRSLQARAARMLAQSGIVLTQKEIDEIEVTDFNLGRQAETGLQLVVYVNTERCCAKELVIFPGQTCPEHYHPPFEDSAGKEETFRVREGTVYLYVPGEQTSNPAASPYRREYYTVWHEIEMGAGDQYTVPPLTKHWFYSPSGAIVSEFSTQSRDEFDVFTDPDIIRVAANETDESR